MISPNFPKKADGSDNTLVRSFSDSGNIGTAWLLRCNGAYRHESIADLLADFCVSVLAPELKVTRAYCFIRTLHPQVYATHYTWTTFEESVLEVNAPFGVIESDMHLASPCSRIYDGSVSIRRQLEGPNPNLDFPILEDLYRLGTTDYLAMPFRFADGQVNIFSIATDNPGGFTDEDLSHVGEMVPVLSLKLECLERHRITSTLLRTYLGSKTGTQVLNGQVRLGDVEQLNAVILFCDLRNSTRLSLQMEPTNYLRFLNAFFGCVATAIQDHGGEILRFVGDAVLAIFPIGNEKHLKKKQASYICNQALEAAISADHNFNRLNANDLKVDAESLGYGLALHIGKVMYGNIGIPGRQEFTVIGKAVNEAAKIESLTKKISCRLLLSADFAQHIDRTLTPMGFTNIVGSQDAEPIFTLVD